MNSDAIKAQVDEYVKWDSLMTEAKTEIEKLKAAFQAQGLKAMEDKKVKQVEFWGSKNSKVVVTTAESPKLVSYSFLRQVIGEVLLRDFIKETTKQEMTEPFKRIVTPLVQGDYLDQSLDDIIADISADGKIRKTLKKKLKGKYKKDVSSLQAIAGLPLKDAEYFAYFVQEAINFEKIAHLLEAAGYQKGTNAFEIALNSIRHAVVVEESVKVGIEYEKVAG